MTTGEYESIWMDALEDDETQLFGRVNTDELKQIDQQIRLTEIRERRMLKRIQTLMRGPELVDSTEITVDGNSVQFGVSTQRTLTKEASLDRIQRIEEALTRVQERKAKLIELKHKLTLKTSDTGDSLADLAAAIRRSDST